jgi:hypothetical protein
MAAGEAMRAESSGVTEQPSGPNGAARRRAARRGARRGGPERMV